MHEGEAHAVQIGDNLIHGDDLCCKANGTDKGIKVALINGKALVDADKVHAYGSDAYAQALH